MSENREVSNKVEFGNHSVDFDAVPRHVQIGFFARTFAHKLGNEVDAAVVTRVRNALENPKATTDAVAAWRAENPDQVAAWQTELRDRLVTKILDGTIGIRESNGKSASKVDPVEDQFHQLVIAEMRPILQALGYTRLKRPNLDDSVTDSVGREIPIQSIYDAIAHNAGHQLYKGDALRKQAERDVASGARKVKQVSGMDFTALGF